MKTHIFTIFRHWHTFEQNGVTLSKIFLDGKPFLFENKQVVGLEDEPRDKKVNGETRIAAGLYEVVISMSNRFKRLLIEVLEVANFAGIRAHSGNIEENTDGCLLVGNEVGVLNGKTAVLNSKNTYEHLHSTVDSFIKQGDKVYFLYVDGDLSA